VYFSSFSLRFDQRPRRDRPPPPRVGREAGPRLLGALLTDEPFFCGCDRPFADVPLRLPLLRCGRLNDDGLDCRCGRLISRVCRCSGRLGVSTRLDGVRPWGCRRESG
jgi:hypothetical protein